jgi:hypothetical protein
MATSLLSAAARAAKAAMLRRFENLRISRHCEEAKPTRQSRRHCEARSMPTRLLREGCGESRKSGNATPV